MAGNIKGITIEFNGEDKGLKSVMRNLSKDAKSFDTELRQIDKSLKFNPNNVTLMGQKLNVLKDAAQNADKRVKDLKNAQAQLDAQNIDKNSKEYRELEREIIKAENQQKNYNKELKKLEASMSPLGQASIKMKSFGDAATKAGEALKGVSMAAAGIDVALGTLAYKSGVAADDLNTLSKVTGISTQELQKYKAAADLVDVSVETIAKSQTKMKKSMLSAAQGFDTLTVAEDGSISGGNATAKAFETLGVKITDSNGNLRDQESVFQDTISALGKMQNETERDALAMQIFGKSATELNPLIEDNGETYKMVADIFKNNNLELVDQETIDKANAFNDEIDKIKATWGAALQSVGMQLAGYLAPAMEKIGSLIQSIAGWLSQLDPAVLTVIGIIAGVVAALAPVLIIVGKVATGISAIMSLMSTLGVSLGAIAGPVGIVIGVIAALIAIGVLLYKNWDTIKAYATKLKDWLVNTWMAIKTSVITTVTNLKNGVVSLWNALKTSVSTIINGIKTTVSTAWNGIKTTVSTVVNGIKTTVSTVWNGIKTTVSTVVNTIKSTVSDKFNSLKDSVSSIFNSVKSTVSTVWAGIKLAITHPVDMAVLGVKTAIAKIKGFFSGLHLSLPKIKLPHFKLSGKLSLAPPSVPKLSIDWYKNGGIFTQPTIFGGVGVGEAGAEAVLPLKKLWNEMDKRFNQPSIVINVNAPQGMDVNALAQEIERRIITAQKRRSNAWT